MTGLNSDRTSNIKVKTVPIIASAVLAVAKRNGLSVPRFVESIIIQNEEIKEEILSRSKKQKEVLDELLK